MSYGEMTFFDEVIDFPLVRMGVFAQNRRKSHFYLVRMGVFLLEMTLFDEISHFPLVRMGFFCRNDGFLVKITLLPCTDGGFLSK